MELKELTEALANIGCGQADIAKVENQYEKGQISETLHLLKKIRCDMLEDMHESQRKVDRVDYLIRRTEKEAVSSEG